MEEYLYHYKAIIRRCIDGDTVECDLDMGRNHWEHDVELRLFGINAPEKKGKTLAAGEASQLFLETLILGREVTLKSIKRKNGEFEDDFGRDLAIIWVEGMNVNDRMVQSGYAVPFTKK